MAAVSPLSGPGKTAPKLCADFLRFDPLKVSGNFNVLVDQPPHVGNGPNILPQSAACKHDYTTKLKQSQLPPLDNRPDGTTQYKLALVCKLCRIHVDIRVDYQQSTDPCPNRDCPVHHFLYDAERNSAGQSHISFFWQCSSPTCRADLEITYKLCRLSKDDINSLTDTSKLKRRYDDLMERDPTREGMKQATPVEAVSRLRKYVKDALNPKHDKKTFPANNKRFMETFGYEGQECAELLNKLGFVESPEACTWTLPNPPETNDVLHRDYSKREFLEDVEIELQALLSVVAAQTGAINPAASESWSSANREVERILAAQGYHRLHSLTRKTSGANEHNPHIASLGACADFGDSLIEFSYQRQADCDPINTPYYFECLQEITRQRGSEDLQIKMVTLESAGVVSRRDLREAYKAFGLAADGGGADDDRIINVFQSQLSDQGPQGQEHLREMLGRIGRHRGSTLLNNASQQVIETAREAYQWLGNGLDEKSPDDLVTTIFAVRVADSKDLEVVGRKAVSLIAKERKSEYLNSWLLGEDAAMDLREALKLLNIDQPLTEVDATLWPMIFENARQGRSGQQTERAIAAVQKALREAVANGGADAHSPDTWPVGLISHGNTCYLNSLLQYYFSLKPLRDIVLNYQDHQLDTKITTEKRERVGQLMVSSKEIEGGQRFAEELKLLFERMIKDPGPAVKPEQDLVCRAFLAPSDSALLGGRQSGPEIEHTAEEPKLDDTATKAATPPLTDPEVLHSSASSVTLANSVDGDNDTTMKGSEVPPTPPASPGLKADDKPTDAPPPLPPRMRRFSTTTVDTLRLAEEKARQQQDVTEVHDSITQRLRAGMKPLGADKRGEQIDPLRDLFALGLEQTSLPANDKSKTEEIADSSILLEVPREPTDLYSALDDYFDPDDVSENSAQQQYKTITSLPPLVQISMPRIYFDEVKKETSKSNVPMRLEDELYLDRYFDASHADVPERRRKAWGWRKRLSELKTEQKSYGQTEMDLAGPTAVAETAKYLRSLGDVNKSLEAIGEDPIEVDTELHLALSADASFQNERLEQLDAEAKDIQSKLTDLFSDLQDHKYRLHAVFFHRGGSSSGHYWVAIHDFQNNIWRTYNDEQVKEVPDKELHEIFNANTWAHGTPTYAVYVRDSDKDKYVEAVCRKPEKVLTPERAPSPEVKEIEEGKWPEDVQMADAGEASA